VAAVMVWDGTAQAEAYCMGVVGLYTAPIREVVDKRGDVVRHECASCARQVDGLQRECVCGRTLLGRVVTAQ
jgi:hypothetical protein